MADKQPRVFFSNYDLYETKGVGGKNKVKGPGEGLFSNMNKYKSVSDFLKKKRKARRRRKSAMLLAIAFPDLVVGKTFKTEDKADENDLQDPYEDQGITPLAPLSPAEVSPIGLLDGMYPKEDWEGKPISNLYYGRLETHQLNVDDGKIKDGFFFPPDPPPDDDEEPQKVIGDDGITIIYIDKKDNPHNPHGPAIIYSDGVEDYYIHGEYRNKERIETAQLWNGRFLVIVNWVNTVLRKKDAPDTQDQTIWIYDHNYNPTHRPNIEEIRNASQPAATLGEIEEGIPDHPEHYQ